MVLPTDPEAPHTPTWWQRASLQTPSPAASQPLISMVTPLRATLHPPTCQHPPSQDPPSAPHPHPSTPWAPLPQTVSFGQPSTLASAPWGKAALSPTNAHNALVNDPPEYCQNLATTKHHRREKKQGEPSLACPKATKKRGRSRRVGEDPEPSPTLGGRGPGALGQPELQKSLPRKDPLTFGNQIPLTKGTRACK